MFVQVIKARTSDAAGVRRQCERWRDEVRPGAIGFLGTTAGVSDDGTFVALARFADVASARANSERPPQHAWWEQTVKLFESEPTFRESIDISTLLDGGSDDAGFVQVMEGVVSDRAKLEELETDELLEQLRVARRDLIGSMRVWLAGGAFVEAAYFTSEADARRGELSDVFSEPFGGRGAELGALFGEIAYIDLRDPIMA
jgi:hypothetical protein